MSNDDYFAQRPGDGGETPPTSGQPSPYAAPGQPGAYGNPAGAPEYGSPAPDPAAPSYGAPAPGSQPYGAPAYGTPPYGTPGYGTPPGQPGYGTPPYGTPGYGTPPGQPGYGYPYAAPKTNGLAIAALVVSLVSLVSCPLIGLAGAIMGHIARRQVAERRDEGAGMALAGIIVGWIGLAIGILIVVFYIVLFAGLSSSGY
jgi:hypothetical protein